MIDLEKERKDFEKKSCPDFNKVTFEITSRYKQGHYKENSSHYEDLDESQTLSMSWFSWLNRAEIAQQTIESLKAQIAPYQSDDYVLVPKVPTQKLYRTFYDAFNSANSGNTAQCFKVAYKAMLEAQDKDSE